MPRQRSRSIVRFLVQAAVAGVAGAGPLAAQPAAPPATAAAPRWIWAPGAANADQVCCFKRTLAFAEPVVRAKLRMTCDNEFEAAIDGVEVLSGDQWERLYVKDVSAQLAAAPVVLAVRARNRGGPAGLIARLDVELRSGARVAVVTDERFEVSVDTAEGPWRPARELGPPSTRPWRDPFVPRLATPAAKLHKKPGYTVELVRSAQDDEGSWISMTFGPRGELYVGVERGGILRLDDPHRPEPVALALPPAVRNPHGLAFAYGALWANVNDEHGGLFALKDGDGDGRFEEVREVVAWKGSGEHGAHAVVPGPDGWLWVVNGNMTDLPRGIASDSPHRAYAEDVLLPRFDDPGGHAVDVHAPGSHVLRIAADGGRIELWAAGLRNAFDLAFARTGELYTFDSDMEWDVGLPWYRPTRVCHVVSGAEFGWRSGSAKWPVAAFDSLPGVIDLGRSSPTGIAFWDDGLVGSAERGALVVADWAFGRLFAVHVHDHPVVAEVLLSGKPLNVTDLAVGPDGALWFVTGGRGTQSGLYRLAAADAVAAEPSPAPPLPADVRERRRLEALHGAPPASAVEACWPALASSDRTLRQVARVGLEHVAPAHWRTRALAAAEATTAMAALLALVRVGDDADLPRVVDRLLAFPFADLGRARQMEWLRVLQVAMARHGSIDGARRERVLAALAPEAAGPLPSGDFALDRERATVLAFLDAPGLVPQLLEALAKTASQAEQVAFAALLGRTRSGWGRESAERFLGWAVEARVRMGGGNSFTGYLDAILDAVLEQVTDPELEAQLRARRAAAEKPRALTPGPFVRAWTMAEVEPRLPTLDAGRSFAGGERALEIGQCCACHRFGERGGSVGPDLTGVGRRLDRRSLLESILDPSRVVSDQYQLMVLSLRDGSTKVGRVQSEQDKELRLLVDMVAGTVETVEKADVVARTPSPVSAMPPGLVNSLTLEQLLDLLAYLENDGAKDADAFK